MLEINLPGTILHTVLGCCIQVNICGMSVNESWNMLGGNIFIHNGIPHFSPDNIGNIPEAPLKVSFKGNSKAFGTFIVLLIDQGQQEKYLQWLHRCFFGFVCVFCSNIGEFLTLQT